jgi:putative transposase
MEAFGRGVPQTGRAQGESRIEEGHLLADHVHMMIAIPPKYAVSQGVESIKG